MHGAGPALALVEGTGLTGYHPFHTVRAELLRRLGREAEAAEEYATALRHTANAAERASLRSRLASLREDRPTLSCTQVWRGSPRATGGPACRPCGLRR